MNVSCFWFQNSYWWAFSRDRSVKSQINDECSGLLHRSNELTSVLLLTSIINLPNKCLVYIRYLNIDVKCDGEKTGTEYKK